MKEDGYTEHAFVNKQLIVRNQFIQLWISDPQIFTIL